MRAPHIRLSVRVASALALVLALGACTKGGQFDPTELFNSDVFDSKKKLSGQREPVFPNGVPGTTTGVPPDLVQGYQPPPDQADADASGAPPPGGGVPAATPGAGAPDATAEAKPKPKPKPKPKLASTPGGSQDPVWNKKPGPAKGGPTRISVGPKPTAPAPDQGAGSQPNWPSPAQAQAPPQTNWPAPPAQAQAPAQTNWPAPPAAAPAQRTAQPSQSIWPNPPATTQ
jgi:hypothetical protein